MSEELTVEELRDWSATEVMGWELKEPVPWVPYSAYPEHLHSYVEGDRTIYWEARTQEAKEMWAQYVVSGWRPDQDLNQLAQVVKAWCHVEDIDETSDRYDRLKTQVIHQTVGWHEEVAAFALAFSNPEAILRALYRVARKA